MSENELNGVERRKSFRLDMEEELIDIFWKNEKGVEESRKIACLDFSRGGVRIDCDVEIPVNVLVKVLFQAADPASQSLHGKVIRCIEKQNGFYEIALKLVD